MNNVTSIMVELLLLLLFTPINTNKSHTKHFENAQKRIIIISLSFTDCNYHGVHRQYASPFGIIYVTFFPSILHANPSFSISTLSM